MGPPFLPGESRRLMAVLERPKANVEGLVASLPPLVNSIARHARAKAGAIRDKTSFRPDGGPDPLRGELQDARVLRNRSEEALAHLHVGYARGEFQHPLTSGRQGPAR